MKFTVAGRKMKITQAIEDHLSKKIDKSFENLLDDNADIHFALAVEKDRHFAEATVKIKGMTIHSEAETDDLYLAMDQAVDKTEKQLKKLRERSKSLRTKQNIAEKEKDTE